MQILNDPKDFRNIIQGATVFSSGGGGSKNLALKFLEQSGITQPGVSITLYRAGDIPDDCSLAFVAELFAPEKMLQHPDFSCGENAFYDLMSLDENPEDDGDRGVLFGEIGAVNVAVPMIIAFKQQNFIIDAASVGRSVAELNMTVFASDNIPMGALVVAARGDIATHFSMVGYPDTPEEAEKFITDAMADHEKEYQDVAGFALYKMTGKALKTIWNLPQYGISRSKAVGEVMSKAASPADAYMTLMPPLGQLKDNSLSRIISKPVFELFSGIVSDIHTTSGDQSDGMVTYGNPQNPNERLTAYYENENMLAKYEVTDGETTIRKYAAIAPDAICYLLKNAFWYDGLGYTNSEIGSAGSFFEMNPTSIISLPYPDMRTDYLWNSFKAGIRKVLSAIRQSLHMDPGVDCPDSYIPVEQLNRIPEPVITITQDSQLHDRTSVGSKNYLITIDCGAVSDISIRYTLDGSLPTLDSSEYTAPVHYEANTGGTIRVIAWDLMQDNSGPYQYFSRESTAPLPCSPW